MSAGAAVAHGWAVPLSVSPSLRLGAVARGNHRQSLASASWLVALLLHGMLVPVSTWYYLVFVSSCYRRTWGVFLPYLPSGCWRGIHANLTTSYLGTCTDTILQQLYIHSSQQLLQLLCDYE